MGHTDVVPANPDGWTARSVRRRGHRRRRVGPRRGRHAEPHRDDGGRVPRARRVRASRRAARSCTSRSPTRRTSARGAPSTCSTTRTTRCAPTTSSPKRAASRCRPRAGLGLPVIVGREGFVLVPHHGARHARARVATVPHRQRAGHRGRDREAARRVPAADADPRHVAPLHRGRRLRTRLERAPARRGDARRLLRGAPDRSGPPGARVHAHDVRAHGHPRRHEDERDPRLGRGRGRHPHAARPARRRHPAPCSRTRSAI